jgi:hypothetical protein
MATKAASASALVTVTTGGSGTWREGRAAYADCRTIRERTVTPSGRVIMETRRICDRRKSRDSNLLRLSSGLLHSFDSVGIHASHRGANPQDSLVTHFDSRTYLATFFFRQYTPRRCRRSNRHRSILKRHCMPALRTRPRHGAC